MAMDIPLLPNETAQQYKDLGLRFPGADRYPGFTSFLAARMAVYYSYGMTGITDPTEDLDVVELHDAFTISDVQTYEDIGIRAYGHGRDYVESGGLLPYKPTHRQAREIAFEPLRRPARLHACGWCYRNHANL